VRYGNVLNSRGSVLPLFLKQSISGKINITDKNMTRFSITLEQGVNFVINCLQNMWGGELFIPKIPSYRILDVAAAAVPNCKINYIGLRPGEKMHEEMITAADSYNTIEFEKYYVILPSVHDFLKWKIKDFLNKSSKKPGKFCEKGFSYNSLDNKEYLNVAQLKKLI
jgi:FlaA1/EpsC-like NDP-sugar epimerase